MGLLRRNLSCFYCGRSSGQSWHAGLKSFHCKNCDATNYLDANGEITDPPASKAASSKTAARYVQNSFGSLSSRSPSPIPIPGSSGAFFCHTCTSNQQFVTQALAEYLPPTTDPRYREYERNIPNYRRQLEARYPQVCSDCEPRVQAQIRAAGYTARTDYIRRMNDKTKHTVAKTAFFTKRRMVGIVAGIVWLAVLGVQLAWNVLGMMALPEDGLTNDDEAISLQTCLLQVIQIGQAEAACPGLAASWSKWSLVLNLLFLWWNPILLRSTRRARGVGEFYKLQLLLFAVRFISWYMLSQDDSAALDRDVQRAGFGMMLMINLAITVVSLYTAQPAPHIVRFHKDVDDSEQDNSVLKQKLSSPPVTSALEQKSMPPPASPAKAFPISSLAPKSPQTARNLNPPLLRPPVPSTPPPEIPDNLDAMDLDTPENASKVHSDHSLFRGPLGPTTRSATSLKGQFRPPAPLQPPSTRQLRSRAKQSRPAYERKNSIASNWDTITEASYADEDAMTIAADDDSEDATTNKSAFVPASAKKQKEYNFQNAKFHANEEETGLEGMLGFFGLKDDPLEVSQNLVTRGLQNTQGVNRPSETTGFSIPGLNTTKTANTVATNAGRKVNISILALPLYASVFLLVLASKMTQTWPECNRIAALIWCILMSAARFVDALNPQRQIWELSTVLAFLLQGVVAAGVLFLRVKELRNFGGMTATATGPSEPSAIPNLDSFDSDESLSSANELNSNNEAQVNIVTVATGLMMWAVAQEIVILIRELQGRRIVEVTNGRNVTE